MQMKSINKVLPFFQESNGQSFKLILLLKSFPIPSNFLYLSDVSPSIYNELITKKRYYVKSKVSQQVLQSFIDHWVYQKVPNIQQNNISEFEQLSIEFDRMKDIIQLYNKYIFFYEKRIKFQNEFFNKKNQLQGESNKYGQLIHCLIQNNGECLVNKKDKILIHHEIEKLAKLNDVETVDILSHKIIQDENGLYFTINDNRKTAAIIGCAKFVIDINIPRFVVYNGQYYLITKSVIPFIFYAHYKTINIHENCSIKSIKKNSISFIKIKSLTISKNIENIEEGFCKNSHELIDIKVSKMNKNFIYLYNSLLLGKSNPKSPIFDVILFARRNIEKVKIPFYIKRIADFAFANCIKLNELEIPNSLQLLSIGKDAFLNTKIKKINNSTSF